MHCCRYLGVDSKLERSAFANEQMMLNVKMNISREANIKGDARGKKWFRDINTEISLFGRVYPL